jgi:hypothetical protein
MGIQYAQVQEKWAALSEEPFGVELAQMYFTDEQIKSFGVYTRGIRKGKLRGRIMWQKVVVGGWYKTGSYDHDRQCGSGGVMRPGVSFGFMLEHNGQTILHKDTILERNGSVDVLTSYASRRISKALDAMDKHLAANTELEASVHERSESFPSQVAETLTVVCKAVRYMPETKDQKLRFVNLDANYSNTVFYKPVYEIHHADKGIVHTHMVAYYDHDAAHVLERAKQEADFIINLGK